MWCHAGCTGQETIDDCGVGYMCPKCKIDEEGEDDIILENVREDEEKKDKNKDESRKREREESRENKDDDISAAEKSPKRKQQKKLEYNYRGVFPKRQQNDQTKNQGNDEQNKKG